MGHASLAALRTVTRTIWHKRATLAGDVSGTQRELREMNAADIYDESVRFHIPDFKVRACHRSK